METASHTADLKHSDGADRPRLHSMEHCNPSTRRSNEHSTAAGGEHRADGRIRRRQIPDCSNSATDGRTASNSSRAHSWNPHADGSHSTATATRTDNGVRPWDDCINSPTGNDQQKQVHISSNPNQASNRRQLQLGSGKARPNQDHSNTELSIVP